MNYPRGARILSLLGFAFILIAIIDILETPAQKYEISIYEPILLAWIALTLSAACGAGILALTIFDKLEGRRWVAAGMFLLILGNVVILLIPLIRGSPFYGRQDILSHIGLTLDVIYTGGYGADNIYPVTHIIATFFALITGKAAEYSLSILIPAFVILATIGIVLLSRLLLTGKARILSMVAGATLIISYTQLEGIPNAFSILFIPFSIYIYLKAAEGKSRCYLIIMIAILTAYAFFHPLVMIILLAVFTAIPILRRIIKRERFVEANENYSIKIPLIGSFIFTIWLSAHDFIWGHNLNQLFLWISGESTIPSLSSGIGEIFSLLNLNETDIVSLFVKMYGHVFIFFILTLMALLYLVSKIFILKERRPDRIALLAIWFPLTVIVLIINLFWTILHFGIWRMIAIAAVLAPIFIGLSLEIFRLRSRKARTGVRRGVGAIVLCALLITPILLGIMSAYPSPWTIQANEQVTEMEISGLTWHYMYKDRGIMDNYIRTARFAHAILGIDESRTRIDIPLVDRSSTRMNLSKMPIGLIPPHFDYVNWSRYPEINGKDIYLPISEYDVAFNTQIYPELNEFTVSDFQKLETDMNIVKTYDNGDFSVYLLYGSD